MAFLFSSSHLPASRVRRPALEDDDHDENPEAMPRSGGVRASSHLEGRVAEHQTARSTGGSPAPRSSGAGIDWMARLKDLAEQQQRRRADSVTPDSGPRHTDGEHEPDAGAEHEDGAAPGDEHEEAPEHEDEDDASSWYHPPESRSYHPDSGFNVRPEDIGHVSSDPGFHIRSEDIGAASPDTGFYQHLSEIKGEDKPAQRAGRPPSSSPDWSGRQSNLGRALPQGGQRSVGPDAPSGSVPSSGRTGVFPNSRLFEMRPHPALATRPASISSTAQHAQSGPNQSRGNLQGLFPNVPAAPATQYFAQAKTGAQQAGATFPTQSPKGQKAAPVPAPAPGSPKAAGPAQGTQPPQAAGSLARYRQQRQKLLDALNAKKKPSPDEAKKIQKQIASITRNMESIELAAHLINHTKQKGEADIDPESIDENSADFKSRARTAIHRLHGGSAPWLDRLAENFGEREGTAGGGQNPPIKDLFTRVGVGKLNTNIEPWCGHALNDAMTRAGIKAPGGAGWAQSWNKWGRSSGPNAGGICVGDVYHIKYPGGDPKSPKGHVATVIGISKDGTQVFCLGGNQNGGLNISAYPISLFKGAEVVYRKPAGQNNHTPAPTFDYHADEDMFSLLSGLTR